MKPTMNVFTHGAAKSFLALCSAAVLLGSSGIWAADTTPPTPVDLQRQSENPTDFNKASSLIGMEVRNNNDEKLGKIEDLVFDLSSGKIAYTVLKSGPLFKTKYLAVPANAYTPSADHKYLILSADKAKLESAKGFDKGMWPSVSNPDWGADTFWEMRPGAIPPTPPTDQNRINNVNTNETYLPKTRR